jgi:Mg/Co/Ni transporter MgtE
MKKNNWKYLTLKNSEKVKVDAEDFDRLNQRKWVLRKGEKRKPQVINMTWDGKQKKIITKYLAREIMQEKKKIVLRKNLDDLDFRKSNLIVVTRKEKERMRTKANLKATSKYKGVSWSRRYNKWSANISCDGKKISLGLFKYEKDAARAYNKAAKKYFREFSYQNKLR